LTSFLERNIFSWKAAASSKLQLFGTMRGHEVNMNPQMVHKALVSQNLLRAANDGYDVSPLIESGADPMSSGADLFLHFRIHPSELVHSMRRDGGPLSP